MWNIFQTLPSEAMLNKSLLFVKGYYSEKPITSKVQSCEKRTCCTYQ